MVSAKITEVYNWLSDGNEITGQQIGELIQDARPRAYEMKKLYGRYEGKTDDVPILTRKYEIDNISKINNKIANDFFGDIVNTKVGYFAGKPIVYKYPDVKDADEELLDGFLKRNAYEDLDSETAKMAAICGSGARYLFINLDGEASVINVPPWECIFIYDEIGVTDAPYAIRYYQIYVGDKTFTKAEFFDEDKITYWIREGDMTSEGSFILDSSEEANPIAHLMDGCPLICFPNNEEMQGDCEKVLTLIDGYDRTLSDMNSEIEQFRLAYMAFHGMVPDDTTLKKALQTGAFGFPEKDSRMEFVTKNINAQAVENHLQMLEKNIIYFAQSVRFTDEAFGGASGVAMKFKIFNLEAKCMVCERKFTRALRRMLTVLNGYFSRKLAAGVYEPYDWEFVFTRNFPLNLMEEAQTLSTLKGLVSDETALGLMSFIEDPQEEMEKMKKEQEDYMKYQKKLMEEQGPMPGEEAPPEEGEEEAPEGEEKAPEEDAMSMFKKMTGG